jgi:hypothetical protein
MSQENVDRIKRAFDAFSNGDLETAFEVIDPSFELNDRPGGQPLRARAGCPDRKPLPGVISRPRSTSLSLVPPATRMPRAAKLEELVLAGEDLAHGVVGEDAAD